MRFRNEGVTNVLFLGEGGLYPLFFMRAADTQGYYPKYGLNTDQAPGSVLQRTAPAAQLRNAIGMGWTPILDVDAAHDPGPVNPATRLCLDIMRRRRPGHVGAPAADHRAGLLPRPVLAAADALASANATSPSAACRAGVAALGTSFAVARRVRHPVQRRLMHDGVDAYRDFVFDTGCKCFVYTSPPKLFPVGGSAR